MSKETLERRFAEIGARMRVGDEPWYGEPTIDVRGQSFVVGFAGRGSETELEVVDVRPRDRHLLLLARVEERKSKFLCGHDERHWFVAAIPEDARGVIGVAAAKAALQPEAVREIVARTHPKDPYRRRNASYSRQGEWFFVPAAIDPPPAEVLRNELLLRGAGSTPHVMQFAFRRGGTIVYINPWHARSGITAEEYALLPPAQRRAHGWDVQVRDPEVYAKGAVRHPDHATLHLGGWHRVLMNTEQGAQAMRHVVFID